MKNKMIKIWVDKDECYDFCFGIENDEFINRWQAKIPEKKYKQLQKLTTRYYKEVQGYLEKVVNKIKKKEETV